MPIKWSNLQRKLSPERQAEIREEVLAEATPRCGICEARHKDCRKTLADLVADLRVFCRYGSAYDTKQHIRALEAVLKALPPLASQGKLEAREGE